MVVRSRGLLGPGEPAILMRLELLDGTGDVVGPGRAEV